MMNCTWELTSAVRRVDSSDTYERLESRLRVHRAALRQCLANKPSIRHQVDMLRLVAVLSTLLVAMKRRMKVPDIARMLHNMPGTIQRLIRLVSCFPSVGIDLKELGVSCRNV